MTVDERVDDLLEKLLDASDALTVYTRLRKAKGYMAISENDRLRDAFFELAKEIRHHDDALNALANPEARAAWARAGEALSYAAVCLLSGRHDCPSYIAVNLHQLERARQALATSARFLKAHAPLAEA